LSEQEQEREDRPDWKDHAALVVGDPGLDAAGCCLFSLLHAFALFLVPISALLLLNR
jgi:hypothetical protein